MVRSEVLVQANGEQRYLKLLKTPVAPKGWGALEPESPQVLYRAAEPLALQETKAEQRTAEASSEASPKG